MGTWSLLRGEGGGPGGTSTLQCRWSRFTPHGPRCPPSQPLPREGPPGLAQWELQVEVGQWPALWGLELCLGAWIQQEGRVLRLLGLVSLRGQEPGRGQRAGKEGTRGSGIWSPVQLGKL